MTDSSGERDLRLRVDHVGIAVGGRDRLASLMELLGGDLIADEPAEGYRWIQYALGNLSRIELIEPTEDDTFLTEFLKQEGPGLHHITLEVADIDAVTTHLRDHGVRVVDRMDHEQYREAFISPRSAGGVLFQLMEFEGKYPNTGGEAGNDADVPDRSPTEPSSTD